MKELEHWFVKEPKQIHTHTSTETAVSNERSTQHNTQKQINFIAIVGFGGLGKTTLAFAMYHKFGHEFDCRASVLASQKFDLRTVLIDLVRQFHEKHAGTSQDALHGIEKEGDEELKKKLADQLKNKRYYFGLAISIYFIHTSVSMLIYISSSSLIGLTRF